MNLFSIFDNHLRAIVASLSEAGLFASLPDLTRVVVEPPRDAALGDLATNAAMVLARDAALPPRLLAERIVERLVMLEDVVEAEIAGPGFINIRVAPRLFEAVLRAALGDPGRFGRSDMGTGERVNVEYVSANPTGPLHVGHCRGAVVGDALASLLTAAGYDVTREYYINDAGAQVDVLGRSAYLRYREARGETVTIPEGLYPGDYLKLVGEALSATHGDRLMDAPEEAWLPICRDAAIDAMMRLIRADLALLNVRQSVFFSERSLQQPVDRVAETIDELRARGDIYEGTLPRPKGDAEDWEPREQTLFRATLYGDDIDRPLMKSDGSYTYFASDIAYHRDKYRRGFRTMIDVWGADHGGYIKRMKAAVRAATDGQGELDVKICQLVKLTRGGQVVKMSKRAGDFVTLRDVVEEVGSDAVRFIMLMRKNDAPLDFDLARVIEQSKDNPVFYVQYAHARCRSTFRQAREAMGSGIGEDLSKADLSQLVDQGEIGLLRRIAQFPRLIEQSAAAHEPHRLAFFLHDLASDFHAHWNRGKDLPDLRFIRVEDVSLTRARLALVQGVEIVLAAGLSILGVSAPDEMR